MNTPLKDRLIAQIRADGPMRLDAYMSACLLDPEDGYYTTRMPFGAEGDFTTAPEISQMFGEMIGLCLAQSWMDQGRPEQITLAELGPGRGTLMVDILRALAGVPDFSPKVTLVLVEASPRLRRLQQKALADNRLGLTPIWVDICEDLPRKPLYLVANEFFDALPIRQFHRATGGWRELHVGLEGEALRKGLGPPAPQPLLDHRFTGVLDGDIVEICAAAEPIMQTVSTRIADNCGAALIIDYGDWGSLGDTFQAVQSHQSVDPFAAPGNADLTAHVDFRALASVATPSCTTGFSSQGRFLEMLGITIRAQHLARALSGNALETHITAHRRLTHPDEMGNLFKVLGVRPKDTPPLPGLTHAT